MIGPDSGDDELLAWLDGKQVDDPEIEHLKISGASGTEFEVMGHQEKEWFQLCMSRYLEAYKFEDIADLQDLDRLLGMELLSYRYTAWLVRGKNYSGSGFLEKDIRTAKDAIDKEIRQLKSHMGMDRKQRMTAESESIPDYLKNLLRRGHEFGVHRDHQIAKAMDLFTELKKLMGLNARTDQEERRMLGVEVDQIMAWIRDVAIPEFDAIDEEFRKNQKLWVKDVG